MQVRIPARDIQGGTSKAVFFCENHLLEDLEIRDRVILAAYGSPDPNTRQFAGMGDGFCNQQASYYKSFKASSF